MDQDNIDTSPSEQSFVEVHATYHHVGRAANRIAGWLRERGYSAHAGHPLMGLALYPPLAQQAGLGWRVSWPNTLIRRGFRLARMLNGSARDKSWHYRASRATLSSRTLNWRSLRHLRQ